MPTTKQQRKIQQGWNRHQSIANYVTMTEYLELQYKAYQERARRLGTDVLPYQEWLEL